MTSQRLPVYFGSYAAATQPGVYAFSFDSSSGQLTPDWSFTGIFNPSFIVLHPNGLWLFAVSETSTHMEGRSGQVWALALPDGEANQPQALNHQPSGGDWPCHLTIDPTGSWLLVTNYQSGSVSVFPILENGSLGPLADKVQHSGHGPHPERQEGPHTHSTIFTPDNRFVVVADLGLDQLVIYTFDTSQGRLHEHARVHSQPGSGPRHMAFHPNQRQFFVAHELNNTVVVYDYDAGQGTFHPRQTLSTLLSSTETSLVADIHVTPAGDQLYVSNRGAESLAIFTITTDGLLEQPTMASCGGKWPRNFALAPSSNFVLVANQQSDEVAVLPVHAGLPAASSASAAIPGVSCVQFA